MKFFGYISEASSGAAGLEKITNLIVDAISKRTGIKFWRFGGHNHIERFKKANGVSGVGLMFVTDKGTMVRFNMERGEGVSNLSSIDYWGSLQNPSKPTSNITIADEHNIIRKIDAIAAFLTGRVQEAEEFQKTVGNTETSSLTKSIADTEKHMKSKDDIFSDLSQMADLVIKGVRPSLIVTGDAGVGKTTAITKQIEATLGPESAGKWRKVVGAASAVGVYRELFLYRNKLILFDDCDDVFKDKTAVLILKGALDSKKEKEISWPNATNVKVSSMDKYSRDEFYGEVEDKLRAGEKTKFPDMFPFSGRIIFISNLTVEQMDPAIVNRSYHVPVKLDSNQMLERLEDILPYICPESNMNTKKEVLNFLVQSAKQKLNARTFVQAMGIRESGNPDWKNFVLKYA